MAKKYSEECKAAALAALMEGQAVTYVAKEYNIPRTTIQMWKNQYENGEMTGEPSQKKQIGELLLGYLRSNIEALQVQANFTKDETWLRRQSAERLAVLHGVMTDKAIRLLEAMSKLGGDDEDSPSKD